MLQGDGQEHWFEKIIQPREHYNTMFLLFYKLSLKHWQILDSGQNTHTHKKTNQPPKQKTKTSDTSVILPSVYLQFAGRNISSSKFIDSVVSPTVGGEDSQQKGAGLQQRNIIIILLNKFSLQWKKHNENIWFIRDIKKILISNNSGVYCLLFFKWLLRNPAQNNRTWY